MNLKLGMQHRILEYYQVCSDDAPGLTLIYFTEGQIWSPMLLCGEKVKTIDFSEIIVVYDIKVGRYSQLNEYMKLYEYKRSRSFIDLSPDHSYSVFLIFFSSVTADFNIPSALRWAIQDQWSSGFVGFIMVWLICCNDPVSGPDKGLRSVCIFWMHNYSMVKPRCSMFRIHVITATLMVVWIFKICYDFYIHSILFTAFSSRISLHLARYWSSLTASDGWGFQSNILPETLQTEI